MCYNKVAQTFYRDLSLVKSAQHSPIKELPEAPHLRKCTLRRPAALARAKQNLCPTLDISPPSASLGPIP